MSDLIDRQAAIDVCKEIQNTFLGDYFDPDSAEYIGECITGLKKLPSAQKITARTCLQCGADSYVLDTRVDPSGNIRRRRECPFCKKRWSTIEVRQGGAK